MATAGLHFRDPGSVWFFVAVGAAEAFARSVMGVDQPDSEASGRARQRIFELLADVAVPDVPRCAIRVNGVRIVIVDDSIIWAGSHHGPVPFHPRSETGADQP